MSSIFSFLPQVVINEVKDRAANAREKLKAVTEKVVNEVVESEAFKKHVSFNIQDHAKGEVVAQSTEAVNAEQLFAQVPRQPLGYISVFVSRVAGLKSNLNQIYVEAQVENVTLRTPLCTDVREFEVDQKRYDWNESEHTLRFPVTDIKAGVAVRVMTENVLTTDKSLGQVLVPLDRLLPTIIEEFNNSVRKKMEDRPSRFVEGPAVYEMFPLPCTRFEYLPAVKDSARTGMNRPTAPLGYVRMKVEFVPNDAVTTPFWVCQSYVKTVPYVLKPKRTSLQAVNLDVARTQRHVKRQLKRLDAIFERIVFGSFAPTLPFALARSWESKRFSVVFILSSTLAILYLPAFLFPLLFFAVLCLGGYLSRNQGEAPPVIWNEDIRDSDDALNPMQRISKLLWILETLSTTLVQYADFFERIIHSCGFRDERASILIVTLTLICSVGMSIFAYFVSVRTCCFVIYCGWMFAPVDFFIRYQRFRYLIQSGKTIPYPQQVQPLLNLLMRIPTTERLGHLHICSEQIVRNKAIIERVEREQSQ